MAYYDLTEKMLNTGCFNDQLFVCYDPDENMFYDRYGSLINILEMITPNDLFLFRQDPGYCTFPHRKNNKILCEILTNE